MALNFPNSPTDGQIWTDPNGQSWVYETTTNSWTAQGAVSGGMVYKGGIDITAAPPAAQSGWTYAVTTGGTPNAGFTGLSGTLTAGTQVTFDGTKWQQSGSSGPWTRTGTVLSPANAGDDVNIGGTNIALKAADGSAKFTGTVNCLESGIVPLRIGALTGTPDLEVGIRLLCIYGGGGAITDIYQDINGLRIGAG